MYDSGKIKDTKIEEIKEKIKKSPLYNELFQFLNVNYLDNDFVIAEALIEQIDIGDNYIKISDPNPKLLDFFKSKGFNLKVILPALETENYSYNVTAWLEIN